MVFLCFIKRYKIKSKLIVETNTPQQNPYNTLVISIVGGEHVSVTQKL